MSRRRAPEPRTSTPRTSGRLRELETSAAAAAEEAAAARADASEPGIAAEAAARDARAAQGGRRRREAEAEDRRRAREGSPAAARKEALAGAGVLTRLERRSLDRCARETEASAKAAAAARRETEKTRAASVKAAEQAMLANQKSLNASDRKLTEGWRARARSTPPPSRAPAARGQSGARRRDAGAGGGEEERGGARRRRGGRAPPRPLRPRGRRTTRRLRRSRLSSPRRAPAAGTPPRRWRSRCARRTPRRWRAVDRTCAAASAKVREIARKAVEEVKRREADAGAARRSTRPARSRWRSPRPRRAEVGGHSIASAGATSWQRITVLLGVRPRASRAYELLARAGGGREGHAEGDRQGVTAWRARRGYFDCGVRAGLREDRGCSTALRRRVSRASARLTRKRRVFNGGAGSCRCVDDVGPSSTSRSAGPRRSSRTVTSRVLRRASAACSSAARSTQL